MVVDNYNGPRSSWSATFAVDSGITPPVNMALLPPDGMLVWDLARPPLRQRPSTSRTRLASPFEQPNTPARDGRQPQRPLAINQPFFVGCNKARPIADSAATASSPSPQKRPVRSASIFPGRRHPSPSTASGEGRETTTYLNTKIPASTSGQTTGARTSPSGWQVPTSMPPGPAEALVAYKPSTTPRPTQRLGRRPPARRSTPNFQARHPQSANFPHGRRPGPGGKGDRRQPSHRLPRLSFYHPDPPIARPQWGAEGRKTRTNLYGPHHRSDRHHPNGNRSTGRRLLTLAATHPQLHFPCAAHSE